MFRSMLIASSLVVAMLTGCSGGNGEAICSRFKTLCNATTGTTTITVSCDEGKVDDASNGDDVEKCMDAAKDCNAATACMLTLKQ